MTVTIVECMMVWAGLTCMIIRWAYVHSRDKATQAKEYITNTKAYTLATGMTTETLNMCMAAAQAHMDKKNNTTTTPN